MIVAGGPELAKVHGLNAGYYAIVDVKSKSIVRQQEGLEDAYDDISPLSGDEIIISGVVNSRCLIVRLPNLDCREELAVEICEKISGLRLNSFDAPQECRTKHHERQ